MSAQVRAGTLQWKMKLEETARLLDRPRLYVCMREKERRCMWVDVSGCLQPVPTVAHIMSFPRSLIFSVLELRLHSDAHEV